MKKVRKKKILEDEENLNNFETDQTSENVIDKEITESEVKDQKSKEQGNVEDNEESENKNEQTEIVTEVKEDDEELKIDEVEENASNITEVNETETDSPGTSENDNVVKLTFSYKGTTYSVDLSSEELGVDLVNYAYFFVIKANANELHLYYSKERINIESAGSLYRIRGGDKTILIKINTQGTLNKSFVNLKNTTIYVSKSQCVATNQNIYCEGNLFFGKTTGDEYDVTQEDDETLNEIVMATKTINVYGKAAINYDIIATIQEGMAIKRIKREVNNRNGHIWDKIELSDGTYGYVFSEEIQLVTDVRKLDFKYNEKLYNIYLSQSSFDFKLDNYEYCFVTKANANELHLYCSNERINIESAGSLYQIRGGDKTILIKINTKGTLNQSVVNLKNTTIYVSKSQCVAANQNIYCEGNLFFGKNSGYEYDVTQEKDEILDEIVMATKTINVYGKAAINYDVIATIQEGMAIKRIKREVNNRNGHIWDKIELSDGTYGYVFSEEIQLVTDARKLGFKYNEKLYNIYLSQSSFDFKLDNYEYYFVTKANANELHLYCSNERINIESAGSLYQIRGGDKTILIKINTKGTLNQSVVNLKNTTIYVSKSQCVAANQIFIVKEICFLVKIVDTNMM